jgi:ElaB/YqjD/DUF883 family membrane-anchored ribosome-binding protein
VGSATKVAETTQDAFAALSRTLLEALQKSPALGAALLGLVNTLTKQGGALAPQAEHSFESAGEQLQHTAATASTALWNTLKQNPAMMAALTSGLVWLVTQGAAAASKAGQAKQQVQQHVQQAADTLAQQGTETAGHVADQVGQAAEQTQQQAQRALHWLEQTVRENPLVVGLAAVAIGALLGLSSRPTKWETQLLGGAREQLLHQVQNLAHELTRQAGGASS